jgi:hypothetical protein
MKTEVIMKRELFGSEISQQSQSEFFSATDLVRAGNYYRLNNKLPLFDLNMWLQSKGTKEFIEELETQFGKVKINSKGKNQHTWVHPFLFIDIALAINPKFKVEVYSWIFDSLLKFRNNSGDSYKRMCGALYQNCGNKSNFHRGVSKTALMIQEACNVSDWQKATEDQLKLRDKIHDNIALLCDVLRDNNQAIRIGIIKAINQ